MPQCPILTHGYLFCHPLTALDTAPSHTLPPPLKGLPLYLLILSLNVWLSLPLLNVYFLSSSHKIRPSC